MSRTDYPPELDKAIRHASRMREFLARREHSTSPSHPAAPWLLGRSGEIQCVVALVALDWYQSRLSSEAALAKLARYLKDVHDGVAMHLDVGMPPCCRVERAPPRAPLARADARVVSPRRAILPSR